MKQLEDKTDKDEQDHSYFKEKMLKREEYMSEENHQLINEEPEVNPIEQILMYMETPKKKQKLVISINQTIDHRYGVQIL